jgi:hypothetical protein
MYRVEMWLEMRAQQVSKEGSNSSATIRRSLQSGAYEFFACVIQKMVVFSHILYYGKTTTESLIRPDLPFTS